MTATLLIHLNVTDASQMTLAGIAEDITDILRDEAYDVMSIVPWNRPSEGSLTPFSLPAANPSTPLF